MTGFLKQFMRINTFNAMYVSDGVNLEISD